MPCARSSTAIRARPACAISSARSAPCCALRRCASVRRHAAMRITEGTATEMHVGVDDLHGVLGALKFESEIKMRTSVPGVATGLAWTPVGGDILFIEASRVPGKSQVILTGQ